MKKLFFVAVLFALTTVLTTAQAGNLFNSEGITAIMQDRDDFVDVKFEDLNENVQRTITVLLEANDLVSLKHNAENGITKVVLSSKEDQAEITVYLNNEGKQVEYPIVEKDPEDPVL